MVKKNPANPSSQGPSGKSVLDRFSSLSLAAKLNLILSLFTIVPLVIVVPLTTGYYNQQILDEVSKNTLSVVRANDNILLQTLTSIENSSQSILDNEYYYETFSRLNEMTMGECLTADRDISVMLKKLFIYQDAVDDCCLYTSRWVFGANNFNSPSSDITIPVTTRTVQETGLDAAAASAGGHPVWITGQDYQQFETSFLMNSDNYRYPVTMVRQMNFQYSDGSDYHRLAQDMEHPILIVHVLEKNLKSIYENSIVYDGSVYIIANSSGTVVSSDSDLYPMGNALESDLSSLYGRTGYSLIHHGDTDWIACYDTLPDQGLFSLSLVPLRSLTAAATRSLSRTIQLAVIFLIITAVLVSVTLTRTITQPINALITASHRVSKGDLSADTPVPKSRDMRELTVSFNNMEKDLDKLIHENYEIKLHEAETQLMALTTQINPHFLYNTLNTINVLAIEHDDEEVSELIVDLSDMLQYSYRKTSEKARLSEEINWLSAYLHIMSGRYRNVFRSEFDIDEDLTDCLIPRMVTQPLAENAILHGFDASRSDGLLQVIVGRAANEKIQLCIRDNGIGMTEEELQKYREGIFTDGHIGISNIHRRLTLLYGNNYDIEVDSAPGKGTSITIRIPLEE